MSTSIDLEGGRAGAADARELGGSAATFSHPEEVLADRTLAPERKREILAAWASDAHALDAAPMLRQLESGAIVRLGDIMSALKALDGAPDVHAPRRLFERRRPRKLQRFVWPRARTTRSEDEDDDPPPPPAAALRETRLAA